MREIFTYGSVRGVARKGDPYRDRIREDEGGSARAPFSHVLVSGIPSRERESVAAVAKSGKGFTKNRVRDGNPAPAKSSLVLLLIFILLIIFFIILILLLILLSF